MVKDEPIMIKAEQILRLSIKEQCTHSSLGMDALNTNKTNKQ